MNDTKKTKLPKRIGGVKLPKKVRKKANKALGALDQPLMRNLASVAFAAVSAAAAKHGGEAATAPHQVKAKPDKEAPGKSPLGGQIGEIAAGLAMAAVAKWLTTRKPDVDKAEASSPEREAPMAAKAPRAPRAPRTPRSPRRPRAPKSPNGATKPKP
jgi:hypothetical protein